MFGDLDWPLNESRLSKPCQNLTNNTDPEDPSPSGQVRTEMTAEVYVTVTVI